MFEYKKYSFEILSESLKAFPFTIVIKSDKGLLLDILIQLKPPYQFMAIRNQ